MLLLLVVSGCASEVVVESDRDAEGSAALEECTPDPISDDPAQSCESFCRVYTCAGCTTQSQCEESCKAYVARPLAECNFELLACAAAHIDEVATSVSCDDFDLNGYFTITYSLDACTACP